MMERLLAQMKAMQEMITAVRDANLEKTEAMMDTNQER
jgi:hypothetical protein